MDQNDYDIFNPQIGGGPILPDYIPSEEEKLYHELIGKYQGIINATGQTTDKRMWESVNEVLQILVDKGHTHYSRFKIEPTRLGPADFVYFESFKSQLMSALQRMAQDFDLGEPSYLIYHNIPNTGTQINNHSSSTAHNSPIQNVTQTNNQQMTISFEQHIQKIEKELEEKLTEEQLAEIKPSLEEYKKEPKKWSNAIKLMKGVLGLSKDVAVDVLAHIIAAQMGLPKI